MRNAAEQVTKPYIARKKATRPTIPVPVKKSTVSVELSNPSPISIRSSKQKPTHVVMQDLMSALPKQFKIMASETKVLQELVATEVTETHQSNITLERVHDRLESMLLEQRTTNILMTKLIALQSSIIEIDQNDLHARAEQERQDAYARVCSGE